MSYYIMILWSLTKEKKVCKLVHKVYKFFLLFVGLKSFGILLIPDKGNLA